MNTTMFSAREAIIPGSVYDRSKIGVPTGPYNYQQQQQQQQQSDNNYFMRPHDPLGFIDPRSRYYNTMNVNIPVPVPMLMPTGNRNQQHQHQSAFFNMNNQMMQQQQQQQQQQQNNMNNNRNNRNNPRFNNNNNNNNNNMKQRYSNNRQNIDYASQMSQMSQMSQIDNKMSGPISQDIINTQTQRQFNSTQNVSTQQSAGFLSQQPLSQNDFSQVFVF
jgi:hypothetical protein